MNYYGLILAAGAGERISNKINNPKCLVKIKNKTILEHQINSFINAGIKKIYIVTGFQAYKIKKFLKRYNKKIQIQIIHNKIFKKTNNMYSAGLANKFLKNKKFILCNADAVIEKDIVKKLIKSDVVFENRSIYDLSSMGRTFEFVFCGDLMEHLKNPLEAIENLRSVTGNLCVISLSSSIDWRHRLLGAGKAILRLLTKQPTIGILDALSSIQYVGNVSGGAFFHSSPEAFREMCLASGFRRVEIVSTFGLPNRALGVLNKHAIFHCFT